MSTAAMPSGPEPKKLNRFQEFHAKYFTPRWGIERAGILIAFLAFSYIVTGAFFLQAQFAKKADAMAKTALYTSTFTTSLSGVSGTVNDVYSNKDHTRAFVLMQFSNPAQMNGAANQYQSWLTGANSDQKREGLKSRPSGSIYVFGNGYMGVYLTDTSGLKSQIMSLTLRSKSQIVQSNTTSEGVSGAGILADPSFKKFDQWNVFFNPGASGTKHLSALDAPVPNVSDLYYQMVVKPQEDEARTKLDTDLSTLQIDQNAISSYTTQLAGMSIDGLKVRIPKFEPIVSGDSMSGQSNVGTGKPSTLELHSKVNFANGYNFPWRNSNVSKGYLDSIVPKGQSYVSWLTAHAQNEPQSFDPSVEWKMTNGQDLNSMASNSIGTLQSMIAQTNSVTQAYQKYFNDKQLYEVTDLPALLNLEVDMRGVMSNNSVNASNTAMFRY